MRILEGFAGSRSIGRIAQERGHEVFSIDIHPFEGISLVADMEHVKPSDLPWAPDAAWFSPPCTTYSMAAIKTHRPHGGPLSEFAQKSDRLVKNVLALIAAFPHMVWFLENPNAALQYQPFMAGLHRVTVWYCRYGDRAAKPTNIFSNIIRSLEIPDGWNPRPPCYPNNPHCHHERAPRGSATGTQGKKNAYERSRIPEALCLEVVEAMERAVERSVEKNLNEVIK